MSVHAVVAGNLRFSEGRRDANAVVTELGDLGGMGMAEAVMPLLGDREGSSLAMHDVQGLGKVCEISSLSRASRHLNRVARSCW